MSDALLQVRDLSVAFSGNTVVDRVSFEIAAGETLALVGESGSGKSVTALSVMQLLPYQTASHPSGSILFRGEELVGAPEPTLRRVRGNEISVIFQEPMTSLNPLHSHRAADRRGAHCCIAGMTVEPSPHATLAHSSCIEWVGIRDAGEDRLDRHTPMSSPAGSVSA